MAKGASLLDMTKRTVEKEFWDWFIRHDAVLLNFETDQEAIFDQLAAQMQKVDASLCFEFGPKGAQREFVISAGGIRSAFAAVVSLSKAAPDLHSWRVTAFRPRRASLNAVEFQGKQINPNDVQFSLLDNGKIAGVILYIPGYREDDIDFKQIGYLMLDEDLGEFDVETKIGLVRMLSPESDATQDRYPLAELPDYFDQLACRIDGRSRKAQ